MFHENLKRLRKEKNISQEMIAAHLNVTRQTVSKWENNLSVPDADLLVKLADYLEVDVRQLLDSKYSAEANSTEETGGFVPEKKAASKTKRKGLPLLILAGVLSAGLLAFIIIRTVNPFTTTYTYQGSTYLIKGIEDITNSEVLEWIRNCENEKKQEYFILYSNCSKAEISEGYVGKFLIYVPNGFSGIDFHIEDKGGLFARGKRVDFQIAESYTAECTYQFALIEIGTADVTQITLQNLNGEVLSPMITKPREFYINR